jgi:hypothetical protein
MVRTYLVKAVSAEPTSLRAGELTSNLDGSPTAVAQQLGRLQEDIIGVSLEHWGRSKNATRHIEAIDS